MELRRWNPWQEMEDMFNHYAKSGGWSQGGQEALASTDWTPRVDILEKEGEFQIRVDIPGVNKDQVKISVENDVLTIQGERKTEQEEKNTKYHRMERFVGSFIRRFTIPENVDPEGIKASFADGTLSLRLPKTGKEKPKTVNIAIE